MGQKTLGGVARDHRAGDGARNVKRRIDLSLRQNLVDLGIGLAKDTNGVFCRLEITFRGLLIRCCLIDVLLGTAAGLEQLSGARERPRLQLK